MKGEIRTAPASALAMPAPGSAERHVTLHTLALENLCSAYSLPRRCEFDEHALGSHASLLVGFDNLAPPRERCSDIGERLASTSVDWHESPQGWTPTETANRSAVATATRAASPLHFPPHANASSTTSLSSRLSIAFRTIVRLVRAVYRFLDVTPRQDRQCRLLWSSSREVGSASAPRPFLFDVGASRLRAAGVRNRFLVAGSRSSMPCA
jgi:hypothetical protein